MARDILPFEFGGGGAGESERGGDIFFGKDDMKEYAWDGVYTEETVRFIETESAKKALRKRSRRKLEPFNCFEFLKIVWCFKF
ncbi:hypothetical protein Csa_009618 [Cucumis sativus]|uniref:Uncharacterized protein n=1 Tax=Cucumis sativus TaxID=3659 RepID=A0A0A0L658_CUCSA|nr:hypothetical protein Csa_009618 [Cucumis sativus]